MKPAIKYYWEDFHVGRTIESGNIPISEEEIVHFARQYDPQPFHIDKAAAADSSFGGIVASGWHTCSLAMRLICDSYLLEAASNGSPGIEKLQWLKPVRPGDTLQLRVRVLESRLSASKPTIGLVRSQWQMFNQDNECVMSMEGYSMIRRRQTA